MFYSVVRLFTTVYIRTDGQTYVLPHPTVIILIILILSPFMIHIQHGLEIHKHERKNKSHVIFLHSGQRMENASSGLPNAIWRRFGNKNL